MTLLIVLVCAVIAMVVGGVWYGPLFGKKWMKIAVRDAGDIEERKKMQKASMKLYIIQFVLTLLQVFILAFYVNTFRNFSGVQNAFLIWLAFVMPTVAGASMWNNDSKKIKWSRFLIQAGYQLVMFIIFGLILSIWR
ncbi:MAG: DUF1761 domain-containing protein [Candidatus Pacebacteria bacterium]|nr:DUF1761 domain-containing protein [Candidatus Paceibacterota bacterium]